jgi:hypothetical protein
VKPTKLSTLVSVVLIGGVVMWVIQMIATRAGYPSFVAPPTFGLASGVGGLFVLALAWPIRQFVGKKASAKSIDPIYATRVVLLAQAAVLAGGIFSGGAVGAGVFLATRPVVSENALALTAGWLAGAILLTVGGLIAQHWCTVRLNSDDPGQLPEEGEIA